ncbi:hypothetical protein SAMN06265338_101934 [Rhodoblastus acidophilus]|uniref:O-antigen ligase n=1 Tax=Rhodoblastus acidophilus TaxID=1074 RepID=A0A212QNP4_RHOAC|nr:hypothetical protein [Rhodoblastus acidophilus]PPQ38931.1 hypothetical protein CKO16_08315 [Rhodoblastus acidophilus]RAI17578.1 hypothetical protein CH337_16175 [Rhodoblastus acidophilus]SNB60841.1 hypothetical protein SAMN06265338_101934 [Rhodoblastus acidophilus]
MNASRSLAPEAPLAAAWPAPARSRSDAEAGPRRLMVNALVLMGLVIPGWEAQVHVAGAKMTAGRLGVTLLVIPALVLLFRRGRRLMAADLAALLTALWMIGAAASVGGFGELASPAAESLQFLFGYLVGRAFYFAPATLDAFMRILLGLTFAMVAIAIAERLTNRWLAHDAAAALFGGSALTPVSRDGAIRATATLDHPIQFGVFCALVNALVLLWARNGAQRAALSLLCLVGCLTSQSSAALMAFALGSAAYAYDRLLPNLTARWRLFWGLVGAALCVLFVLVEHPIGWIVSHLTLDPESGFFRMIIWDRALAKIDENPLTGYAFNLLNDPILDSTVDCVWLVEALRYGAPAILLLAWANIAAVWPARRRGFEDDDAAAVTDRRLNLGFAIVLLLFMFSSITVHFWNYMWIFWALCIGIKASLRERLIARAPPPPA